MQPVLQKKSTNFKGLYTNNTSQQMTYLINCKYWQGIEDDNHTLYKAIHRYTHSMYVCPYIMKNIYRTSICYYYEAAEEEYKCKCFNVYISDT